MPGPTQPIEPLGPWLSGYGVKLTYSYTHTSLVADTIIHFNPGIRSPNDTITTGHQRATSRSTTVIPPPVLVPLAPKRSTTSTTVRLVAVNRSHSALLTRPTDTPTLALSPLQPDLCSACQRAFWPPPRDSRAPCTAYVPHLQHPSPYSTSRRAFGSTSSAMKMGCCSTRARTGVEHTR